jgi:hypothetical protein
MKYNKYFVSEGVYSVLYFENRLINRKVNQRHSLLLYWKNHPNAKFREVAFNLGIDILWYQV